MKRVNGPKWRGQTAKAQSLASKPPILTEVFGWMWSARELASGNDEVKKLRAEVVQLLS
jgi:hypothetical protein